MSLRDSSYFQGKQQARNLPNNSSVEVVIEPTLVTPVTEKDDSLKSYQCDLCRISVPARAVIPKQ